MEVLYGSARMESIRCQLSQSLDISEMLTLAVSEALMMPTGAENGISPEPSAVAAMPSHNR